MRKLVSFMIAAMFAFAITGCGDNKPPPGAALAKSYPVQGQVTLKGSAPLKGGMITFRPESFEAGIEIRFEGTGLVDANGKFKIGMNGNDMGVPPGKYKVAVQPREYRELRGSNSNHIPTSYREPATTQLAVEVKAEENTFRFDLR